MATFTGTNAGETIRPNAVSTSVSRVPPGSVPSAAADSIDGRGGADTINGGGGADVINAGAGNDTIYDAPAYENPEYSDGLALSANAGNLVHGNAGNDRVTINIGDTGGANPASNAVYGDGGNDTLLFHLSARAYAEAPWLGALPTGSVSLYGGAGNDATAVEGYFVGGMPGMTVTQYGGDGNDKLHATTDVWEPDGSRSGGGNTDNLYGGAGDDTYVVWEAKDTVSEDPNGGIDNVVAYEMDYTLPADVEHLQMTGGYYPDGLFHGTGNDLANVMTVDEIPAYVGDLSYVFDGKGGNDTISGFAEGGDDTILGGAGNDTLRGRAAGDSDGYYSDADTIHGGSGNDRIYGGSGKSDSWDSDDTLYGEDGNDRIWGSFGNDTAYGGKGSDQLRGQAGNDALAGGEGADKLYGGGGRDTFDYDYLADSLPGAALRDVISDFTGVGGSTRGEQIDLSGIDADTSTSGNGAFTFVGTSAFTAPGQVRVAQLGGSSQTLVQANVAGASGAELEIAVNDGSARPGAWNDLDFIL
ncbi:MAG: calcium-binding protein [Rhodospirillales bacterium]|nr:calcium-binding protein [Rhodospirillales bacterium]